jgi:hypothetical protein
LFRDQGELGGHPPLTYGTARVLVTGDAEAREEYVAEGSYTEPLNVVKV